MLMTYREIEKYSDIGDTLKGEGMGSRDESTGGGDQDGGELIWGREGWE